MYGTWKVRTSFVVFKDAAKVSEMRCSPASDKED